MTELPTNILTDAGFTAEEADTIVKGLIKGVDLHQDGPRENSVTIEELSPEKKEALERFNMAVAADG